MFLYIVLLVNVRMMFVSSNSIQQASVKNRWCKLTIQVRIMMAWKDVECSVTTLSLHWMNVIRYTAWSHGQLPLASFLISSQLWVLLYLKLVQLVTFFLFFYKFVTIIDLLLIFLFLLLLICYKYLSHINVWFTLLYSIYFYQFSDLICQQNRMKN